MDNDHTRFVETRTRLQREAAEELARAREQSHAAGKEPFDLALLEAAWRDNPDAHHAARGIVIAREERIREWEQLYYRQYPAIRTNAEFIERMKQLQLAGFFD